MTDKRKYRNDHFYGTVTVGERGQIVIPADARRDLEIETGEKLIVLGMPNKNHLMICKLDSIREFLEMMTDQLRRAEEAIGAETDNSQSGSNEP